MNGLQRLFLRITPIIMLICFICFGITHAFQQEGQANITYLTHQTITIDDNNTITTTDDLTIENYEFDFTAYRTNIQNSNILKRAVTNTIDTQTYKEVIERFNTIWQDGYQFLDGVHTIVNALVLVVDSLIIPINVVITPLRIIAGVLSFVLILLSGSKTLDLNPLEYAFDVALFNACFRFPSICTSWPNSTKKTAMPVSWQSGTASFAATSAFSKRTFIANFALSESSTVSAFLIPQTASGASVVLVS